MLNIKTSTIAKSCQEIRIYIYQWGQRFSFSQLSDQKDLAKFFLHEFDVNLMSFTGCVMRKHCRGGQLTKTLQ